MAGVSVGSAAMPALRSHRTLAGADRLHYLRALAGGAAGCVHTSGMFDGSDAALPVPMLTDGVVTLDALRDDDAEAYAKSDDDAIRAAWGRTEPATIEQARRWIEQTRAWWDAGTHRCFAIREAGSPAFVGRVDVWPVGRGARIAIFLDAKVRRAGYAGRATALACRYAFEDMKVRYVDAEIIPENEASQRLARSMGFEDHHRGQTRDGGMLLVYRLSVERWRASTGTAG